MNFSVIDNRMAFFFSFFSKEKKKQTIISIAVRSILTQEPLGWEVIYECPGRVENVSLTTVLGK